jgi:hypothetical protein
LQHKLLPVKIFLAFFCSVKRFRVFLFAAYFFRGGLVKFQRLQFWGTSSRFPWQITLFMVSVEFASTSMEAYRVREFLFTSVIEVWEIRVSYGVTVNEHILRIIGGYVALEVLPEAPP